jgi:hypothetical protein
MKPQRTIFFLWCWAVITVIPTTFCLAEAGDKGLTIQDDRYIQTVGGIVADTKTGLEWLTGPDQNTTWREAKLWVEGLSLDGGRWRMPTLNEVKALYQHGVGKRNMSPLLKTTGWYVWAGETEEDSSAWHFNHNYGNRPWLKRCPAGYGRGFAVRKVH